MRQLSLVIFSLLFCSITFGQTVIPISNIRQNDANGQSTLNGTVVTIRGVVTCSNQLGASGPGAVQDATAGVSVYGTSFVGSYAIGDSVQVTSTVALYNGLTQLDMRVAGSTISRLGTNKKFDTTVVTCAMINNQTWNGFEQYESRLIKLSNVTISGTGNFVGNTNYTVTDSTGSAQIRIATAVTSVVGTPIPGYKVDVIGILSQYKSAAPYSSGYQLMIRSISDIIGDGRPLILQPVLASNIQMNSVSIYFQTGKNGNTIVKYGKTNSLELDSVVVAGDTTNHRADLVNLQTGTTYYYKAISQNAFGRSESAIQSFTTATNNNTGTINVYFNYPVDTTVAMPGNAAQGNVDFSAKLVERINATSYSIDMAVYSFNGLANVTNALLNAKNRGVKIRIVYDSRDNQTSMTTLLSAGIKISKRVNTDGIMHNKFLVCDHRDANATNDWVWMGSWNLTSIELDWKNNVLEINDAALAAAYQTEFEEMWGSTTDDPNPANAKFGADKSDNTPHTFNIGGRQVYSYFSPSDGTTTKIVNAINSANYEVFYCQYSFTRNDQGTALYNRKNAGVTPIRGIIDQTGETGTEFTYLSGFSEVLANAAPTLHHKYCVIDASHPSSDPTVVTGSHNWSTAAETKNDENTLIVHDAKIANKYMQEFKKRYNDLGGSGVFIVPTDVKDNPIENMSIDLMQNYPNPFNPQTTIRVMVNEAQNISVDLFDVLGNKVGNLYSGYTQPGIIAIDLDANSPEFKLSSGVYFYRLTSGAKNITKKLVLLK